MKQVLIILATLLFFKNSFSQVMHNNRDQKEKNTHDSSQVTGPYFSVSEANQANSVIVYEHSNFTGQSKSFSPGTYNLASLGFFNEMISSLKIPAGMVAVLYEHVNGSEGSGAYIDLMENCPDLVAYNFNDKTTYLSIFPGTRPGHVYIRNRLTNNQFSAGRWERIGASGKLPDNSPPAVSSNLTVNPVDARSIEDMPVYRIVVSITTGTTKDAGTDSPIFIQLHTLDEKFYLVKGIDNFTEGKTVSYDVLSLNIKQVKDIEFIRFGIGGSDGVCFKRVTLWLNNATEPVYNEEFPGSTGVCFDNRNTSLLPSLDLPFNKLRSNANWNTTGTKRSMWDAPTVIQVSWLKNAVEGSIGNQLHHGGTLKWSPYATGRGSVHGDAVRTTVVNDHTVHFKVKLERMVTGPNPLVEMDFDLDFHCTDGTISCDLENVKTGTNWVGEVRDFLINKVSLLAAASITVFTGGAGAPSIFGALLLRMNNTFRTPGNGTTVAAACLKAQIAANGDIILR